MPTGSGWEIGDTAQPGEAAIKTERGCVRSTSRSTSRVSTRCGWVFDHSRAPKNTRDALPFLGTRAVFCGLLFLATMLAVQGFPPAPHHVFYGLVRDELGNPIAVSDAEVFLQGPSGIQIKTAVVPQLEPGQNYRLSVPMDAGLTQDLYKPTAMRPTLPFKLWVRIGNTVYLPIEMSADYAQMGKPAESTRLNLTLGEDSDGDGLPDAWERALIATSGGTKTLKDIKPGDDFDGDGLSNLQEYVAGTYAFDDKDGFSLKAVRKEGALTVLEFLVIRGRTYTIYGSNNLQQWTPVSFRLSTDRTGSLLPQVQAADTKVMQALVDPRDGAETMLFFKLMVQ